MGTCIICGTPVDGWICESHEEDVFFDFHGTAPSHLSPNRFYRGTVDGYADFGVFVDIGDHVTGLLHRSELDQRLESLDWEPGDEVFVQVLSVRDNGNVDLGWSIRQSERDFRGHLIETANDELRPDDLDEDDEQAPSTDESQAETATADVSEDPEPTEGPSGPTATGTVATAGGSVATERARAVTPAADADPQLNRSTVDSLGDEVGSVVRLEGEITGVRQTSGPTVFELRDETGTVECAAFEEAGVRAYPSVEVDDVVALEGEVERHYGDLQVETETLTVLDAEERMAVTERLEDAIEAEANPGSVSLLADHDAVAAVDADLVEAATAIRRAVMETRPIVIRHGATADGYVAGAAIERAVLPLIREKHTREDAVYHYVERRPLEGRVYDMDDATNDVTTMLDARDRHGEQLPLVVLVDAGSTAESIDAYDLLSLYGAETLVVDDSRADAAVAEAVTATVAPSLADVAVEDLTTTALAVNLAVHVNPDVRAELAHLPAVSYWEDTPEVYRELATEAGYDETAISERREAVALEAYYQSYKDKRKLVADLLFDGHGDLAAHVSEQFRTKLATELETARENATVRRQGGVAITVLDTDAFTHRYNFPTTVLLLDELHRVLRDDEDADATIGVGTDELHVRTNATIDVRKLGETIANQVPDAGVSVCGGADGHVEFLPGKREAVREAAIDAIVDLLA